MGKSLWLESKSSTDLGNGDSLVKEKENARDISLVHFLASSKFTLVLRFLSFSQVNYLGTY